MKRQDAASTKPRKRPAKWPRNLVFPPLGYRFSEISGGECCDLWGDLNILNAVRSCNRRPLGATPPCPAPPSDCSDLRARAFATDPSAFSCPEKDDDAPLRPARRNANPPPAALARPLSSPHPRRRAQPAHAGFTTTGDVEPAGPATWTGLTTSYIGDTADGTLTVNSGSQLTSFTSYIGYGGGVAGTVTIDGTPSQYGVPPNGRPATVTSTLARAATARLELQTGRRFPIRSAWWRHLLAQPAW